MRYSRILIFLGASENWKTSRYQLLHKIQMNRMKMNDMWFSCFPSHIQHERKVRDMLSHDIIHQTVILDNYVEGSLPKGLANQMGLAILTRLVPPRPNLGDYFFLNPI